MLTDILGRPIVPGGFVAQRNFENPARDCRRANCGKVGRVKKAAKTRVHVIFPDNPDRVFAIPPEYLVVVFNIGGLIWKAQPDPDDVIDPDYVLSEYEMYDGPELSHAFELSNVYWPDGIGKRDRKPARVPNVIVGAVNHVSSMETYLVFDTNAIDVRTAATRVRRFLEVS